MIIYLIYENMYDKDKQKESICFVYPYKNFENALKRVSIETGKTLQEIKELLHASGYVSSGIFLYRIEETELL